MDMTKEEFIVWIRQAATDRKSPAYQELYNFLVQCFVRADVAKQGRVTVANFDSLVEEAAAMPRKYGYAPKTSDLFQSESQRKAARSEQFRQIDTDNCGYISLEKWIKYAIQHIVGKLNKLPKDYLGGSSASVSKEEFISFIKRAVDKHSPEYKELYFFLLKTFQAGDVNRTGEVDAVAFDKMIEAAAAAPRRFGLAPKSSDMFPTDWDRLSKRKEDFDRMDANRNGTISFDEWLEYTYKHIVNKVASL